MITDPVRVLIADDEPPLREYLKQRLLETWPELEIVAEVADGLSAEEQIRRHQPDIAFLDIQMPGQSGLEVASKCHGLCHIVFVTAYDEFAVAAFEAEAVDYLQKPVLTERLQQTITRLKQRLDSTPTDLQRLLAQLQAPVQQPSYLQWLRASVQDEVHIIAVSDVLYFQASDGYTSAVTSEREYLLRVTIRHLEEQLDPDQFWRIHRSTLVAVCQIASSTRDFAGRMSLKLNNGKATLSVSRGYQHLLKAL